MLEEEYSTINKEKIENIVKNIFIDFIDIEHIQSYHDKDGNKRESIWNEWQDDINSIGNLMVLEQNINRSVGNHDYPTKISIERKLSYHKSNFSIVKNHLELHPHEWNLKKCLERKESETRKILDYLFS